MILRREFNGAKHGAEVVGHLLFKQMAVGERSFQQRSVVVRQRGAERSENAGMSSVRCVRTAPAVNLRFPTEGQSA